MGPTAGPGWDDSPAIKDGHLLMISSYLPVRVLLLLSDTRALAPTPLIFGFAALFAWAGWYHLFKTHAVCDMIAKKGWPKFLAKGLQRKTRLFCL